MLGAGDPCCPTPFFVYPEMGKIGKKNTPFPDWGGVKEDTGPVGGAGCQKTAWVRDDELHYCTQCYRKVARLAMKVGRRVGRR